MSSNMLTEPNAIPVSTTTNPLPTLVSTVVPQTQRKRRHPAPAPRRRVNHISLDLSQVPDSTSPAIGALFPRGDGIKSTDSHLFASTSDDDSQGLDGVPKKRFRGISPSVCSTDVDSQLHELNFSNTPSAGSAFTQIENSWQKYLDINTEYEIFNDLVVDRGSPDYAAFHFKKLTPDEHKHFLTIAERVEKARNFFEPSQYRRLKVKVIPEDTRIVYSDQFEPYLLTSFSGESLDTYVIKNASLAEAEIQPIVKQILEILDFCHSVNMFMLDFKPTKFAFSDKDVNQLRLRTPMCLRLSQSIDSDRLVIQGGALLYMAPEMLSKKPPNYSGVYADMWALGVMTFFLFTREHPFFGSQPNNVVECIRHRRFNAPIGNVSYLAKQFVYGLLCPRATDRGNARRQLLMPWIVLSVDVLINKTLPPTLPTNSCIARHDRINSDLQMQGMNIATWIMSQISTA